MTMKIFSLLFLLSTTLFSKQVLDSMSFSAYDNGESISVSPSIRSHYESSGSSSYTRAVVTHKCTLYDATSGRLISRVKSDSSYGSLKFLLDSDARKGMSKVKISCTSRLNGNSASARKQLVLKKPRVTSSYYRSSYNQRIKEPQQVQKTVQQAIPKEAYTYVIDVPEKTKAQKELEYKEMYRYSPNIFIGSLHIYNIQNLSYKNQKRTHIIVKASSGHYSIPVEKLAKAELFNIPSKLRDQLESALGKPIGSGVEQIAYNEPKAKKTKTSDILVLLKKSKAAKIDSKKWLFVIAIEDYAYTDKVIYSSNSAKEFVKVMQKRLGISPKHTRALINKDATSGKIRHDLKDILTHVKHDDTLYFYYSGHGVPVPSQSNAPYLLAQDIAPENISEYERFKLQNIYKALSNSKASKIVAFVDSCFSGGVDNQQLIKGVAATRVKPKKVSFDKSKMIVISAGSGTQYSNKYEEKSNRLFSYYVMRGVIKNNSNTSRLYDYVKSNVTEVSYDMGTMHEQIPVYEGNIGMGL